ncbi:MAG: isocitrate lyase/PEP mutase family protein, partial [Lachnospiraceae bacterium]|nr:isocitrate lyase/PEP mutase family protein [Lachnospiraceae bacterium]
MENVENVVISLTDLLKQQQVVAPSVYDNIAVRAVELCHFPAAVLSGAGLAYSMCGLPDIGLLNVEEMKWMTQRMTYYTPLPVIVDAGNGFGETAVQVGLNVMRLVKAGAKAVIVDDSEGLRGKDVAFLEGQEVRTVSRELFLAKIRAAVEACENTDAVVIARTEALFGAGLEEAIERCTLARKAGACLTEVDGASTLEEAKKINEGDPGWKMWPFIPTVDGKPAQGRDELDALGFRLIGMWYTEKASMYGML